MPQLVVVDQVLVAKRDAEHPLAHQGGDVMRDALRRARIAKAPCEAPHQADGPVRGPEQQRAGIGGDRPAVEAGHHTPGLDGVITHPLRGHGDQALTVRRMVPKTLAPGLSRAVSTTLRMSASPPLPFHALPRAEPSAAPPSAAHIAR